ncbi:ClpP crotonase [Coniophora puteana RWD-64-598 SS2]|uniref:ClpP crotonase n=1 Tax=Coniophora puteana (strain RWD-64-598) TaxID=741705 RepID=A0A5M3N1P2_CONPW|nr:ClpP crotonase [Coniophora puteana RWD-64-598 SS2]EIW85226.1 ClpP crotonase [Coniophora puteana RWD-64-598 SS2]
MSTVTVDISQGIATITLNAPKRLNALSRDDYDVFAKALREIDKRDDVVATVWQATGRWFCAGTDVSVQRDDVGPNVREQFLHRVAATNTECSHALSSHSKILVAALNGPVMGMMFAALLGNFDFIYSVPEAWLYVGFAFLGISVEGGASVGFVNKMGLARANEVLIFNKKKTAQELESCGFINKIFPSQSTESFHASVRQHLLDELDGLDAAAVLSIRNRIREGLKQRNDPDSVTLRESYGQAERFATGIPAVRFGKVSRKEIRHKL